MLSTKTDRYSFHYIGCILHTFPFQYISSKAKSHPQTVSSSENIPVIGAMLGTCVIVIIGIIVSFFVIRYESYEDFANK